MRASFDQIAGKGLTRRDELYPLIASRIRAERTHRQARSISYRFSLARLRVDGGAKFPVLKDLDKFVFAETTVDAGLVPELATGTFLDAKRNTIFIGGTGTGKTHLAIAVASAVIRTRVRGRFFNFVDLVDQLEQEKTAGRIGRLAGAASALDLPFHPNVRFVAECGREFLVDADATAHPARQLPFDRRPAGRHQPISRRAQPRAKAFHLKGVGQIDPGQTRQAGSIIRMKNTNLRKH